MDVTLNIWAILVCGVGHFLIGALWYSPLLFGKPWAAAKGIDMNAEDAGASPLMYLSGLVVGLILAAGLAVLLDFAGITMVPAALLFTAIAWLAFLAMPTFANAVFGGSYVVWVVDSTYPLVTSLAMSVLLVTWV